MLKTTALKITASLSTDIILSPNAHLTLDSVLHHALTERFHGDAARALKEIPLKKSGTVFAASAAFFPMDRSHYSHKTRVACLRGDRDAGTHLFTPNAGRSKSKCYAPFETIRDTHGTGVIRDRYQSIAAPSVFWYANGDEDEIGALLEGLVGLGRRCNSGHGQIDSISICGADEDFSLVLPNGRPARPVPIEEWTGDKTDLRIEMATCVPPYFDVSDRECVIHDSRFVNF